MAAAKSGTLRFGASFQQVMLRIRDPAVSIPFYRDNFGMTLVEELHFSDFSLYFLASSNCLPEGASLPKPGTPEASKFLWTYPGTVVELTHNHGTEKADMKYHNGNSDPRGFGHIGFLHDDVYAASAELEAKGVAFHKRPDEGRMKGLAFALDPDGYWIEIVRRSGGALAGKGFSLQQVMLRVKDPKKSLEFYRDLLGMRVLRHLDFPEAKFSLWFLATVPEEEETPNPEEPNEYCGSMSKVALELTYNYGTESDPDFKYHNGNEDPRGFGHVGFLVPDVYETTARLQAAGVEFQKLPDAGTMKGLAFAKDPDGYWVELIKRGGFDA